MEKGENVMKMREEMWRKRRNNKNNKIKAKMKEERTPVHN